MQGDDFVDATIANLKIIGMLQKNDKIRVHKGNISIDRGDGAVQALRRWLNRDSRDVTLIHLRNTITNAVRIANTVSCNNLHTGSLNEWTLQRLVGEMAAAEIGLQNLRATYTGDSGVVAAVDVMTERLRANCEALIMKHNMHARKNADEGRHWRLNYVADLRGDVGVEEEEAGNDGVADDAMGLQEEEDDGHGPSRENKANNSTTADADHHKLQQQQQQYQQQQQQQPRKPHATTKTSKPPNFSRNDIIDASLAASGKTLNRQ